MSKKANKTYNKGFPSHSTSINYIYDNNSLLKILTFMNIATPFGVMWMALDQHLKIQVSALILQINGQQRNRSNWPLENKTR